MIPSARLIIHRGVNFRAMFYTTTGQGQVEPVSNSALVSAGLRRDTESGRFFPFDISVSNPYIILSMSASRTRQLRPGSYRFDVVVGDELKLRGIALVQETVTP